MQSELGKIKRQEREIQKKSQEDAHKNIADIIESSERILNAIDLFEKNGGDLFKRQLKHATKSYRKILFGELNKIYDFMETAGVGDGFLMTVKANSFLQGLIANMSAEQRNKLILSAESILNESDDKEEIVVSEPKKKQEEVVAPKLEVVDDEKNDQVNLDDEIDVESVDWGDEDLDDGEPFVNPLDEVLKNESVSLEVENTVLTVSVTAKEVEEINAEFTSQGREVDYNKFFLAEVIKKNNIDMNVFAFSGAEATDSSYVLTFKIK